jgi:hypothetical protein
LREPAIGTTPKSIGECTLAHSTSGPDADGAFGRSVDKCRCDLTQVYDPHRPVANAAASRFGDAIDKTPICFDERHQSLLTEALRQLQVEQASTAQTDAGAKNLTGA